MRGNKKWIEVATENLVRYSSGPQDFDEARKEWVVTERVIDNALIGASGGDLPSCELCFHERLRWQFGIRNSITGKDLLVGSTCITKFDIPIQSGGISFFRGEIRDKLLINRVKLIKQDYIRKHLGELLAKVTESGEGEFFGIRTIRDFWEKNGFFSPAMAVTFIASCRARGLAIPEVELSISLRTLNDRLEILHLPDADFRALAPYLEESQIRRCAEIRRVLSAKKA